MPARKAPSRRDCIRIAGRAGIDPRPVAAYFEQPDAVRPATRLAIRTALAELQMPDPWPARTEASP